MDGRRTGCGDEGVAGVGDTAEAPAAVGRVDDVHPAVGTVVTVNGERVNDIGGGDERGRLAG